MKRAYFMTMINGVVSSSCVR